ncbi:MAG: hypothetical protein ACM3VV_03985 [Deltaproteobacteria bacterium]
MLIPPNTIVVILDDFVIFGKKPIDTLSIPATSNVIERRKTRNPVPNPGFNIIAMYKAMAMIPTIICKILIPLETLFSDAVFIWNDLITKNILKKLTIILLYTRSLLTKFKD